MERKPPNGPPHEPLGGPAKVDVKFVEFNPLS